MSEMVERAARAHYAKMQHLDPIGDPDWDGLTDDERHVYTQAMRAAIAAMREPTEAMTANGLRQYHRDIGKSDVDDLSNLYRAMIDAAMNGSR